MERVSSDRGVRRSSVHSRGREVIWCEEKILRPGDGVAAADAKISR
jgi:hypothetical protein